MEKLFRILCSVNLVALVSCQASNDPNKSSREVQKTESPARAVDKVTDDQKARYLAKRWGFPGYIRCGYYLIHMSADAVRTGNNQGFDSVNEIMILVGKVKPYVNPVPDNSLIDPALKQFALIHMSETSYYLNRNTMQCLHEIGEAIDLTPGKAAEVERPVAAPSLQSQGAIQNDATATANDDAPAQHDDDGSDFSPFANLLPGRWAAQGEACGAATNFLFEDAHYTYRHGDKVGHYKFSKMHLTMTSPDGESEGDVIPGDIGKIEIAWKGWKKVSYSKCDVD